MNNIVPPLFFILTAIPYLFSGLTSSPFDFLILNIKIIGKLNFQNEIEILQIFFKKNLKTLQTKKIKGSPSNNKP